MNNQIPYMDNYYMGMNIPNNITNIERLNNRVTRLEKQVRILENRLNRLTNNNYQHNDYDDNDNMYML